MCTIITTLDTADICPYYAANGWTNLPAIWTTNWSTNLEPYMSANINTNFTANFHTILTAICSAFDATK